MSAYRSELYYDVVIGNGTFLGWRCIFAGDRSLVFRYADGTERSFSARCTDKWLNQCWDEFVAMAEAHHAQPSADHGSK